MNLYGVTYSHKGWFGMCPVYVGDVQSNAPDVIARHPLLEPLLHFCVWLQEVSIATCSLVNPHWEPVWAIRITGKLK